MILKLRKLNVSCACGCEELPKGDLVNKINGKYYSMECGKIYRLLVESNRRIKEWCNAK